MGKVPGVRKSLTLPMKQNEPMVSKSCDAQRVVYGVPGKHQEVGKVKTVFIMTLRYLLLAFFHCVDIYRNDAKAKVGQIAGALPVTGLPWWPRW